MPGPVLKLGDTVPNFSAETTQGHIDFHAWMQVSHCDFLSLKLINTLVH